MRDPQAVRITALVTRAAPRKTKTWVPVKRWGANHPRGYPAPCGTSVPTDTTRFAGHKFLKHKRLLCANWPPGPPGGAPGQRPGSPSAEGEFLSVTKRRRGGKRPGRTFSGGEPSPGVLHAAPAAKRSAPAGNARSTGGTNNSVGNPRGALVFFAPCRTETWKPAARWCAYCPARSRAPQGALVRKCISQD